MKQRLIYFTHSFPYGGIGSGWKNAELDRLAEAFGEVVIVPFWQPADRKGEDLAGIGRWPNIRAIKPLFSSHPAIRANIHKLFRSPRIFIYLKELASKAPYKKKPWLDYWLTSSLFIEAMRDHPELRSLLFQTPDTDTYLYFFWGVDSAYIIPFLNKSFFKKIIVRFHGYDLYEDDPVYSGYLPYRKPLANGITDALFVSRHGLNWFNKNTDTPGVRKHVAILGAEPCPPAVPGGDGALHLLSCSSLVPLKRVHILAGALRGLTFPVVWTHIGAGEEAERVAAIVQTFPANIRAVMPGFVNHAQIREFYAGKQVDLFINISETEGMPVSIMEAMAAGVPVVATDVGGSPEIVGAENGRVLPAAITAEMVADALSWFYHLPEPAKAGMRAASAQIFEERLNAQTNAGRLAAYILS